MITDKKRLCRLKLILCACRYKIVINLVRRHTDKKGSKTFSQMIINKKRFSQIAICSHRFFQMIIDEKRFLQVIMKKKRFSLIRISACR